MKNSINSHLNFVQPSIQTNRQFPYQSRNRQTVSCFVVMNQTIVACFRFLSNNRKYSELNVRTATSELITRSLVAGAVLVVLLLCVFRSEAVWRWLTVILRGVWWRSLSDRFTLTQANRINSIGYTENDDHTDPTKARAGSVNSSIHSYQPSESL